MPQVVDFENVSMIGLESSPVAHLAIGIVTGLIGPEMPLMHLLAVHTQRVVHALIRPGDEAVERDRHVARNATHGSNLAISSRSLYRCRTR